MFCPFFHPLFFKVWLRHVIRRRAYDTDSMKDDTISYALLESAIRPDIQPKSSISHEAEPSAIWMTEGGWRAGLHFPTGRNEFITCPFTLRKNNKYIA